MGVSKGNAFDPILDSLDVEVDQETESVSGKLQVGEHLRGVYRLQAVDRLEFDDNEIVNNQIEPQSGFESFSFINHRQGDLPSNAHAGVPQLILETDLVDTLQQSRPQSGVHGERRVHNRSRSPIAFKRNLLHEEILTKLYLVAIALILTLVPLVPWWSITPVLAQPAAPDKSGVKPQVLSLPSGPGSIEGLGGSFEPQLNTGTSAYSVSFAVTPGRAGLEPKLALTYDSGSGSGHFGVGWKLPLESIRRQFDKGLPSYNDDDVFLYSSGEELVPLADGTWRCENEADFMRFRQDGDGWEVTARNGTIYRLRTRIEKPGATGSAFDRTFEWFVDAIEDTNGNRIEYRYESFDDSPGVLYLSEVRYSQLGSAYNAVLFEYEPRPDAFSDYRSGFLRRTARRGVAVRMESNGERVREYRLSYEATADEVQQPVAEGTLPVALRMSQLTKVVQFDRTGRNFLPPLRFGYTHLAIPETPPLRQLANAPLAVTRRLVEGKADLLDVNGDGLPDVVDTAESVHVWYPNLGRDRFDTPRTLKLGDGLDITGASLGDDSAVLADMDGDGMSDLVRFPGDTVFRNRGDGSWAEGAAFENLPATGIAGPDVRWVDVDFDKATDIVVSSSGSQWLVCDNPNQLDVDHPPFGNFPSPEDIVRSAPSPALPAGGGGAEGFLQAGSWNCRTQEMPFPESFVFSNPTVQLADMNGDRVQDVVELRVVSPTERSLRYWPGMGELRFDEPVVVAPENGTETTPLDIGTGISDANARLVDVNADGLSDLVAIGNGYLRFWINLGGERWSQRFDLDDVVDLAGDTAIRFADMNGNGTTDLVWIRVIGTSPGWFYLDFLPDGKANQLSLIDNGLGRRIFIEYASSTEFMLAARDDADPPNPWTLHAPTPLEVVSRVVTKPSLELDGKPGEDEYLTEFVYRDAYYDGYEKEFRGFAFVKKIERGDEDAPTQVSRIWFHTGAPDGDDNDGDGATDERTDKGGLEEESIKGRILRQQIADASGGADGYEGDGSDAPAGAVFSTTTNQWAIRRLHAPEGGRRPVVTLDEREVSYAFASQSDTALTEQGRGEPRHLRTTLAYDDFGNVTLQGEEGALERTGDERYTFTSYAIDEDRWILDKPAERAVRDLPTEAAVVVTRNRFYYDGADYQGLPLGEVTRGNLTREQAWVVDDEWVNQSRKAYDEHGNVIGIMDALGNPAQAGANGHLTEVEYDPEFKTFPVKETIHLGDGKTPLEMRAEYDLGFGVMTASVDFNANRTSYGYDSFGRLTRITKPYDSEAFPTEVFSYHMADPFRGVVFDYDSAGQQTMRFAETPSLVKTGKREQSGESGLFEIAQYVDGLGRKLALLEEGETSFILRDVVRFNARGTVRDNYQPYETSGTEYSLAFANHFTTSLYDATGREVQRINPPETAGCQEEELNHQGTKAPKGDTKNEGLGLLGALVVNPCRTFVRTEYRPLVKSVFDENGNEMTYVDDGLKPLDDEGQRLVEVQEVNEGERYHTFYEYNALDSLTRIEDAQQNVKVFVYDGMQRKTFMNDPNRGVMSYEYDAASNLVSTLDAKGQTIVYAYDGVNRLLSEDYVDEAFAFSAHRSPDVEYQYDQPRGPVALGDGRQEAPTNTRGFLVHVDDLSGAEHTSYDERGRVKWTVKDIPEPRTGAVESYKTELRYDSLDRVTKLIYADGDEVNQIYNSRSLLEQITGGPSGFIIAGVEYAPSGQLARTEYGNGVVTTHAYDPRLRQVELRTTGPEADLLHYDYTFDGASNILRIDDQRPGSVHPQGDPLRNTQIFDYDDLYRLTRVQYSFNLPGAGDANDGTIEYSYDRIGNMLSQTSGIEHRDERTNLSVTNLGSMTYGNETARGPGRFGRVGRGPADPPGPHALTGVANDSRNYPYDANGNMTRIDDLELTWDFKDRLVAVDHGGMQADYIYDYSDRRVVKKVKPKGDEPARATYVLYPDRTFEVREDREPVKYVWNGSTRIAQMTTNIERSTKRVQRFALSAGWNLLSVVVDADDEAVQLGIGTNPAITSVWRWDDTDRIYEEVSSSQQISAGSVLWIRAAEATSATVAGSYEPDTTLRIHSSEAVLPVPNLNPVSLDNESLAEGAESIWMYAPEHQLWEVCAPPRVQQVSCSRDRVAVGEAFFVRAGSSLDESVQRDAAKVKYFHNDHLLSSTVVVGGDSAVISEGAFLPFGRQRELRFAEPGYGQGRTYSFGQKEADRESGLHYFEARYLAGVLGRFVSADPLIETVPLRILAEPQKLNAFSFALNNPIRFSDPTGEESTGEFIERKGVEAASRGDGVATFGWAFASASWDVFGFESLSRVADRGSDASSGDYAWAAFEVGTLGKGGGAVAGARKFFGRYLGKEVAKLTKQAWKLGGFKSAAKWESQMAKRGWTLQQIDEAVASGERFSAENLVNKGNTATRYVHPETGRSVVLDDVTNEVIHVGGDGFKY